MSTHAIQARAIVLDTDRPGRFEVRQFEIPALAGPGEALIRIHLAGICGSDLHQFTRKGGYGLVIPGHEMVGEIVSLGNGFEEASGKPLKVGDRVVAESTVSCLRCAPCRGFGSRPDKLIDYDSCENYLIVGKIPLGEPVNLAGTYAEYMLAGPNLLVHLIDADVTDDEAVLLEPLAVGVKAALKAGVSLGDVVVIEGPGPIGLSCAVAVAHSGAAHVIVTGVDGDESRLALALEMGATATINVTQIDALEAILELTGGRKAERVIDCSGARAGFDLGLKLTARNGVFTMVGGYPPDSQLILPYQYCFRNMIDLRFSHGVSNCYQLAYQILRSHRYPIQKMITHRWPLEEAQVAIEDLRRRDGGHVKVVLDCS